MDFFKSATKSVANSCSVQNIQTATKLVSAQQNLPPYDDPNVKNVGYAGHVPNSAVTDVRLQNLQNAEKAREEYMKRCNK